MTYNTLHIRNMCFWWREACLVQKSEVWFDKIKYDILIRYHT
jgi:hypothetical protein